MGGLAALESVRGSFADACAAIHRHTGVQLEKRQAEALAQAAASDVDAFYAALRPDRSLDDDASESAAPVHESIVSLAVGGQAAGRLRPEPQIRRGSGPADTQFRVIGDSHSLSHSATEKGPSHRSDLGPDLVKLCRDGGI